ncbi:unnamed protein product, partial [Amoebophrya sp. A120]|eukprot:GSA120T00005862001.1
MFLFRMGIRSLSVWTAFILLMCRPPGGGPTPFFFAAAYYLPYPPYYRAPCECEEHNRAHRWLIEVMLADMFANPRRSMSFYRYDPNAPANLREFFENLNDDGWCQRFISGTYFDVLRER